MTPDAKLQIFAIKRGMIETRMDVNYYLPEYQCGIEKLKKVYSGKLRKISDFADVVCGPFGSAIKNADYQSAGIPLLRITNISADGNLDYKNIKFISKKLSDKLEKTQVTKGDIVVSQRGSLGLFAIVDDLYPILNISANLIAIKNVKDHDPEFIKNYLNSAICQKFLQQAQSGQIQSKITTADISNILVPEKVDEKKLNRIIVDGFSIYQQKLQQAEELLAGMDEFITNHIGLAKSDFSKHRMCLRIKRMDLNPRRLDALFYMPSSCDNFNSHHECRLADIAILNSNSKKNIMFSENVPYVGLPECSSNGIISIEKKKYKEVSGRNIAIPGDILFARIEPSIFNKKYVWTDNLHGHEYVFLSTEFYTIRAIDFSLQKFIYAMLFYPAVYEQFFGKTVGSTGRRRLDKRSLEDVIIPMPDIEICKAIGEEFFRRQKMAEELKLSAEKEWQEAKKQFEKELLGE